MHRNILKTRRSRRTILHFDLTGGVSESDDVYTPNWPNWTLIDLGLILSLIEFLSLFYELYPCMMFCLNRLEPLTLRMMSCFVTVVLLLLPLFQTVPLWPLCRCWGSLSFVRSAIHTDRAQKLHGGCLLWIESNGSRFFVFLSPYRTRIYNWMKRMNSFQFSCFNIFPSRCGIYTIPYLRNSCRKTSMNATFSIFPRKRFYEENIDQNSYFNFSYSYSLSYEDLPVACSNAL